MDSLSGFLHELLASGDASRLTFTQVAVRGILVYVGGLALVRASESRFLGKETAFDVILGFLLGSMLSRAINGTATIGTTMAGALALVLLHRATAMLAFWSHRFGNLVKGRAQHLVRNGRLDPRTMRRNSITEHDLREGVRVAAHLPEPTMAKEVYLERNGRIGVVTGEKPPRVIEVRVAEGVQTVRIEIA